MDPAYEIVSYDRDRHAGFLFGTFANSLSAQWPWSLIARRVLVHMLESDLADEAILVRVAQLEDAHLGIAVTRPAELIWCYVAYPYRRMGIACALLAGAGLASPFGVRYWTRASIRAYQRGAKIHFTGGHDEDRTENR